jgi:uncharacterized protein YbbC (DUF1343 family)
MRKLKSSLLLILFFGSFLQCGSQLKSKVMVPNVEASDAITEITKPIVGAAQLDILLPKLRNKNIALVVNHTAMIGNTHLADTLKNSGISIKKVFAPEHGFRGNAADGENVKDGVDTKTGLPIASLYGNTKKPTPEQLADVDVVIFDIQDVGVRFYTFISTLHYVMEACAEQHKKLLILDRPNPNGHYVDGPVLDPALKSFVGMHPIPIVHGLTVGELGQMINGEGWLANGVKCDLEVIQVKNWEHKDLYSLPQRPSPNLPNDQSIQLYPSLGLFEGTAISVGRGTQIPFLVLGNPELKTFPFQFTPEDIPGMAQNPPHKGKVCYGLDLRNAPTEHKIMLHYIIDMYNAYPDKEKFFNANNFIDKLSGSKIFKQQIRDGLSEDAIRESWKKDLDAYKIKREKYLLYK